MKPVPAVRTLVLLLLAFLILSAPAQGQDPCPSASGPSAEAGWAAYADNDLAEARHRFEAAVTQCHNDQYARTGLGYVYHLQDGAVGKAERLGTVVTTSEPNNIDALVGLGLARWRSGDIDAVRDYFRAYLCCGVLARGFARAHCSGCGSSARSKKGAELGQGPLKCLSLPFSTRGVRRDNLLP